MPSPEWIVNNGFAVFAACALMVILDRRLSGLQRSMEKLNLQIAIMLDRATRASEHAATASESAAKSADVAVQVVKQAQTDANHT